ncbi:2-hydroxychromene-2-carboxylate isomerase [Roseateles sp. DAIF2]|uniref:2-hydroxychromene-2-carboxylate isomerase n=1 Tax=Roseateles sp. DAIF2 TaxID=2714952 RepID=UPI0018A29B96|nr:2-hydroxychromene-2-carboxylate isomerase [Roseateles sp. DAIF2]QPF73416.1 2-hydroxychromene-2-carboxylate isomerase [Roseateles sp. DAIF2]
MKKLSFYFDPVSPYAALAFERLPEVLEGCSYEVEYRPVLFAALLHALGQKGPAEIESKRHWTFRQVAWLAHQLNIPLDIPAQHPFNPLPLLRLAWAAGSGPAGTPNRLVVEKLFHHVWRAAGADANDPARLAALTQDLAPAQDPGSEAIKQRLRESTEAAIQRGVFGVPTIEVDGRLFWGLDALPMLAAYLKGDPWFASGTWEAAAAPRPGVVRKH